MSTQAIQGLLVWHIGVLHSMEALFARHLAAGRLQRWSASDVRDAIKLSARHKLMAMAAIEHHRLDQAIRNIETITCIMGGFLEDLESGADQAIMN